MRKSVLIWMLITLVSIPWKQIRAQESDIQVNNLFQGLSSWVWAKKNRNLLDCETNTLCLTGWSHKAINGKYRMLLRFSDDGKRFYKEVDVPDYFGREVVGEVEGSLGTYSIVMIRTPEREDMIKGYWYDLKNLRELFVRVVHHWSGTYSELRISDMGSEYSCSSTAWFTQKGNAETCLYWLGGNGAIVTNRSYFEIKLFPDLVLR